MKFDRSLLWTAALPLTLVIGCGEPAADAPAEAPPAAVAPGAAPAPGPAPTDTAPPAETAPAPSESAPAETKPADTAPADAAPAPVEAPKGASLSEDEINEIKNLPEADQKVALAQLLCPISGENLGSMGTPLKVSSEGKDAFLCCKGCKSDFESDPKAALAKLEKK